MELRLWRRRLLWLTGLFCQMCGVAMLTISMLILFFMYMSCVCALLAAGQGDLSETHGYFPLFACSGGMAILSYLIATCYLCMGKFFIQASRDDYH